MDRLHCVPILEIQNLKPSFVYFVCNLVAEGLIEINTKKYLKPTETGKKELYLYKLICIVYNI